LHKPLLCWLQSSADMGVPFGALSHYLLASAPAPSPLQVNLKLFQPAPNRRRTLLLFVFRDRTKTPLSMLIETWEADLARMWEAIAKPPQYEQTKFTDFFEVAYAALPNYEERTEEFQAEAVLLRRKFTEDGARLLLTNILILHLNYPQNVENIIVSSFAPLCPLVALPWCQVHGGRCVRKCLQLAYVHGRACLPFMKKLILCL
jgi:hypothetical protein